MSEWWRHAVVYQVYVRSFADSDGDGIGDLRGVASRLPYLRDLGVDAVWLTPFYRSPQLDHGYDVADYLDVDPLFGSLEDADALMQREPTGRAAVGDEWSGTGRELFAVFRRGVGPADEGASVFPSYSSPSADVTAEATHAQHAQL